MNAQVDEATVRQFIEIISAHAAQVINGAEPAGVLQLCRINPLDEKSVVPSRFKLDDVEHMVKTAIDDAAAGHNVYIEGRTVRADLRGNKRGSLEDTQWVFGLTADCDADKILKIIDKNSSTIRRDVMRRRVHRQSFGWLCRRGGMRLRAGYLDGSEDPGGGGSSCWRSVRRAVYGRTEIAGRLGHLWW